jgi:hypothetical protein
MVCSNCHRLIHYYNKKIPLDVNRFNEKFIDYKEIDMYDNCPICGNKKLKKNRSCSQSCGARIRYNIN